LISLIGTPRYRQRALDASTNFAYEFQYVIEKLKSSPHALLPVLYSGSFLNLFLKWLERTWCVLEAVGKELESEKKKGLKRAAKRQKKIETQVYAEFTRQFPTFPDETRGHLSAYAYQGFYAEKQRLREDIKDEYFKQAKAIVAKWRK